jgi:hypothetical protein
VVVVAVRDVFRKIAAAFRKTPEVREVWVASAGDEIEKAAQAMDVPKDLQEQERGKGGLSGTRRRDYGLLCELSQSDVDTRAIVSRLVEFVMSSDWLIQPNLEDQYAELDRWMELEMSNLQPDGTEEGGEGDNEPLPQLLAEDEAAMPEQKGVKLGKRIEFETKVLDKETVELSAPRVKRVYEHVVAGDFEFDVALKRLNVIFDQARSFMEQRALQHCVEVRERFEHPNERDERDWPTLMRLVLNDLFVYDFMSLGLNGPVKGRGLAEMYWVPGDEIRVLRTKDTKKTPEPPQWAWIQKRDAKIIAHFTTDELLVIRRSPQKDGYGLSPIECIIGEILTTESIEGLNRDEIKSAYLSAGILNLGSGLQGDLLRKAKSDIQGKVMSGKPRDVVVMAGISGADTKYDRLTLREEHEGSFEKLENRAVGRKCRAFGVNPQDIGLIAEYRQQGQSETSWNISKVAAIRTLLVLLEQTLNQHVVWRFWPYKDVMFHFPALDEEDPRADVDTDIALVNAGIFSRADIAQKHNKPVTPGQRVRTISTGAGIMPVDKVEEVWQRDKVAGQFPAPPEGQQPGAGGEQAPAPGIVPGMTEGVEYPELGNPFAEQKMVKAIDKTRGVVTRRTREIQKALEEGNLQKAKDKAALLASQADREFEQLKPDEEGELPGQFAGEIMGLMDQMRRAAHEAVETL